MPFPIHLNFSSTFFRTGLKRDALVTLVERQKDKWPESAGKFQRGKTNIATLTKALIKGEFTMTDKFEQRVSPVLNSAAPPTVPSLAQNAGSSVPSQLLEESQESPTMSTCTFLLWSVIIQLTIDLR